MDGAVSPTPHGRNGGSSLTIGEEGGLYGTGQYDPFRLAGFEFQHAAAERMPFEFATQLNERRCPSVEKPIM